MNYRLHIPMRLPGLNEYIAAMNGSRYDGNKLKRETQINIGWCIRLQLKGVEIDKPVYIKYTWHEENRRRDKDNVASAKKFIQDALVETGVLKNDGWSYIKGFSDEFKIDRQHPGVDVEIIEEEDK